MFLCLLSRKTRDTATEYNSKEEKYNKKQDYKNNKNKNENNKYNDKSNKDGTGKNDKKKEYVDKKNIKNKQKNKGQTKEEVTKEYVNKKTEKYSKKVKENTKYDTNEPLNGRSYDIPQEEIEKLIIEQPETIIENEEEKLLDDENKNKNHNIEITEKENGGEATNEETTILELTKNDEKENCNKCNNVINEEKLLQCNKKTDSVERNTTEICEKYKSEKNTQVIEEKIITDKQEVLSDKLDVKQQPKCEL